MKRAASGFVKHLEKSIPSSFSLVRAQAAAAAGLASRMRKSGPKSSFKLLLEESLKEFFAIPCRPFLDRLTFAELILILQNSTLVI